MFLDGNIEEKRGGIRDSVRERYNAQKEDVRKFINSLEFKESHYCRSSTERKYLACDLNIEKLFKLYHTQTELKEVKALYFRYIFNNEFNISFGSPATDVCSTCLTFYEKIRAEKGDVYKFLIIFLNNSK